MSTGHIQARYGDFRFSAAIHDQDPNNPSNILLAYNRQSVNATWNSGATWNREHVWPQSRQPGSASNSSSGNLGDPHALRPANPGINSSRGNKPFGFSNTFGTSRSLGQYWFPGDADKGDIARSLFYSDTRWGSSGLSLTNNFPAGNQMGELWSLISWHYQDPPDEFERRRNHTIYSSFYNPLYYTNNRNAFIDRPEYVWSIYVDQQNDSRITIAGGELQGGGASSLDLDFGEVIVGSNLSPRELVTLDKNGLDGTYYSVQTLDGATSDIAGFYNAFQTGATDSRTIEVGLQFDPNLPGQNFGLIGVDNLDVTTQGGTGRGGNDGDDVISLSVTVLDHANPSFSNIEDVDTLLLDLGDVALGAAHRESSVMIHNLDSPFGRSLTATLDLDQIDETDPDNKFNLVGPLFVDLPAGQNEAFSVTGVVDELGLFTASYDIMLSDADLSGETDTTIELNLSMDVIGILGDMNGGGSVNNMDISPFVAALLDPAGFAASFPDVDPNVIGDFNDDGVFNNSDISGFANVLLGT
ncbi:MAG: endonuclease [Planctomycetota bacterium]